MKILSLQTLIDKGACLSQVELFREKFGESVEVTESLANQVVHEFDFDWAARHLLSTPTYKEYKKLCAPAYEEYKKMRDLVYKEYKTVCGLAYEEYKKVCAIAFAKLYNKEE